MSRPLRSTLTLTRSLSTSPSTSFASSSRLAAPEDKSARATSRSLDIDALGASEFDHFSKDNEFNDVSWMGYLKMIGSTENLAMAEKVEAHREVLKAHRTTFRPPTKPIRLTQTIDLVWPEHRVNNRRTALIPVSSLPLGTPEAIHRCKIIAGPRWTPGRPGIDSREDEMEVQVWKDADGNVKESGNGGYNAGRGDIGKDGWLKMSGDKLSDGVLNARVLSDNVDRLVEAANDPNSPIPIDIPVDTRHVLAFQSRKQSALTHSQKMALKSRKVIPTEKSGFPLEWLKDEVAEAVVRKQGKKQAAEAVAAE